MRAFDSSVSWKRLLPAFALAVGYALILYASIWLGSDTLRLLSGLILMPMAIASVFSAIADPKGERPLWFHVKWIVIVILVLLVLSVILFREGGICVAMAAPFFFMGAIIGSALTVLVLRHQGTRKLPPLMIMLPLLLAPLETYFTYEMEDDQFTSVIEIDASPADIWAETIEIRNIAPPERQRTFSHDVVGVPKPVDARMEGQGVGAVRQLQWTDGVRFQEVVTAWDENRRLAWDFRFGPDSIPDHVEAHIDVDSSYLKLARGEYVLEPLADGRSRLTLTTHYRIATPINAYCKLWGRIFLNDFHSTVLKVIKARVESRG